MPKIVDHHARRTVIAEALMRVAAADGLAAVSLRHVAREAGVSTGMVQHYFATKDEMMTFALRVVSEDVEARLGDGFTSGAPRDVVRALLVQMLPVDPARRREGHVGLAFHAYAAVHPHAAEGLRHDSERMEGFVAGLIRGAQESGGAPADLEPERAARALLALVEGLSMHVLGQGYDADAALAVFDAHLATVFGH